MVTDEQRRARNAEKQRAYRARQAVKREAERDVTGNDGDSDAPTTMRDEVAAAIHAMKWLVESDRGSVAQARMLAEDVDVLRHQRETAKALSAQRALSRVLADLGGTPAMRLQRELRSLKGKQTEEGSDGEGSEQQGQAGANVSAFKRPEKRAR